jgi:hypothetical protein
MKYFITAAIILALATPAFAQEQHQGAAPAPRAAPRAPPPPRAAPAPHMMPQPQPPHTSLPVQPYGPLPGQQQHFPTQSQMPGQHGFGPHPRDQQLEQRQSEQQQQERRGEPRNFGPHPRDQQLEQRQSEQQQQERRGEPRNFGPHPRDQQLEQRQSGERRGGEQQNFGPHARDQQPEQRQSEERRGGERQNFGPHQRMGNERLVQGHPHNEQGLRDSEISGHHHYQHFGEPGYYQDGQWNPDDSYPVYQDTIPDDGVLPPVATDTPPLATDTPPLVEGSPSSVCYVNIPQDQVLDVRDTPSGDNVVSSLENGTDVAIVNQQQTWVFIKLIDPNNPPDNLGWVLQDYIQCGSDPQ